MYMYLYEIPVAPFEIHMFHNEIHFTQSLNKPTLMPGSPLFAVEPSVVL